MMMVENEKGGYRFPLKMLDFLEKLCEKNHHGKRLIKLIGLS